MKKSPPPSLLRSAYGDGALVVYAVAGRPSDHFYNSETDATDDLASALPLTLGGPGVYVTCTARCVTDEVWGLLAHELGVPLCERSQVVPYPMDLDSSLGGRGWADRLDEHLRESAAPGGLVMAQPSMAPKLKDRYRIPPELSAALNDKLQMPELLPAAAPPRRLSVYINGRAFSESSWPGVRCVAKVSGSCSGEGVWRCEGAADWEAACAEWREIDLPILIEPWVAVDRNIDLEFMVPADPSEPPVIVGAVEQVVDGEGRLAGGVCNPKNPCPVLPEILETVRDRVLPRLRALGWHGVGGFDILTEADGSFHFIDPNLRITDFTAALWRSRRAPTGESSLILPYMQFEGSLRGFRRAVAPLAREADPDHILQVHALLDCGDTLRICGALRFWDPGSLLRGAARLQEAGLSSRALSCVEEVAVSPAVT